MGEYAKRISDGEIVKIGTLEDMYYLRASQRHEVVPAPGEADVRSNVVARGLRFRFPWPDEDGKLPGDVGDEQHDRACPVNVPMPAGLEHYSVQFTAHVGYVMSLPCPEGAGKPGRNGALDVAGFTVHRNGFGGAVQLTQQKLLADGRLVPVCRCGGCGALWRVEDPADIMALAVALRAEADRLVAAAAVDWYHAVADRVLKDAGIGED